mgnify:CR=1 FL=1
MRRVDDDLKNGLQQCLELARPRRDQLVTQAFANAGIIALRRVIKKDLDRLARATGATIVTGLDELKPEDLGSAALVEEKRIGSGIMTFVSGTKNHSATLLLRGGTQQVLNGLERALDDALHAVADVVEDKKLVAGGGAPVLPFRLMDADVMKIGGPHHDQRIPSFHFQDLLGKPGNFDGMMDPLKIRPEIFLHFQCNPFPK